jgi:hypothetical protein
LNAAATTGEGLRQGGMEVSLAAVEWTWRVTTPRRGREARTYGVTEGSLVLVDEPNVGGLGVVSPLSHDWSVAARGGKSHQPTGCVTEAAVEARFTESTCHVPILATHAAEAAGRLGCEQRFRSPTRVRPLLGFLCVAITYRVRGAGLLRLSRNARVLARYLSRGAEACCGGRVGCKLAGPHPAMRSVPGR